MSEPTDKHPLIEDFPGDTLENCADILAYLRFNESASYDSEEPKEARSGRFCILWCVEDALRYEAAGRKQSLQAVS